jgi:DNA-binding CsgD family transcriptional regulator
VLPAQLGPPGEESIDIRPVEGRLRNRYPAELVRAIADLVDANPGDLIAVAVVAADSSAAREPGGLLIVPRGSTSVVGPEVGRAAPASRQAVAQGGRHGRPIVGHSPGTDLIDGLAAPSAGSPVDRPAAPRAGPDGWSDLTERELAVAALAGQALTNIQIAHRLFISPHTVGYHLRQIYRKLDIDSRVHLARIVEERRAWVLTT